MMLREVKKCVQGHIMSKLRNLNQAARPQNSLINHNATYTLKTFLFFFFLKTFSKSLFSHMEVGIQYYLCCCSHV